MPSRVDGNQKDIVRQIRCVPGWQWTDLTQSTHGKKRRGDGLLRAQWMPPGMVVHIEIKTDDGKLKPHQKLLASDGNTVIVRSFDDARDVMDRFYRLVDRPGLLDGWNRKYPRGDADVVAES